MEDTPFARRSKNRPPSGNTRDAPSSRPATTSLTVRPRPPTASNSRPQTAQPAQTARSPAFTTKRGLTEMASLLDALETKLKDAGLNVNEGSTEIAKGELTGNLRREFIDKELAALINDLNLTLDPQSKVMKHTLGEEQVSYTLLHRALRELIKEKQLCATEVESMRDHVLEKESTLIAELHHAHALRDALAEKLRNSEASLASAHQRIQRLQHRKQVLKESLLEERESVGALLKQKLHAENALDSANAHVSSLTTTSGVYESKLSDATDRMTILTKQQMRMENKQNIEAVAYESKIANLSKVSAERKEALERGTAELADMSRQNQVLRTQLAAAQTQLNHLSQRLAERHQSDLKALEAHRRSARERERERERDKIDPPTGVVTLVFTDVQGSTAQWEANPEIMTIALDVHFRVMREHMVRVGGYECKTEGDAFMIAFQSALQAVHWCMFVQEALLVADWPPALMNNEHSQEEKSPDGRLLFRGLRVRIGAHTGTPQCHLDPVSKRMDYFGPMVNRAARVSGLAHGGQVVVSGRTWREVEADISGVDVLHLGEHTLKGIKGKEQIIQVLPITLAGRKFPPLNDSDAKKPHFEERAAAPLPPLITNMLPQDAEEDPAAESSSPPPGGQQMPQAFVKMREFSRYLPDGAPQGEMLMVVTEAERQLRLAYDEIEDLKNSRRTLVSRMTDNEGRLAALDELEAEAAEWRGMVDNLTAERRALEDLVRAEHAEKEFFLRKLMDANRDGHHGLPNSASGHMKNAEEMEVPDFIVLPEKEKIEAFMRLNSKIRSLEVKVKVLQGQKQDESMRLTMAHLEAEKQRDPTMPTAMMRTVQQAMSNAHHQEQDSQPVRLSAHNSGGLSNPSLLSPMLSPKPSATVVEKEKEIQILTDRVKSLEQVISKVGADNAAKTQSSQNHIASLLQRLADSENALVVANSLIKTETVKAADLEKINNLTKENTQLKIRIKELEDELDGMHRGKDEISKQLKELRDLVDPVAPGTPKARRNSSSFLSLQGKPAGVDVAGLMKKLKTYKDRIDELEGRAKDSEGIPLKSDRGRGEGDGTDASNNPGKENPKKDDSRREMSPSPRLRRNSVGRIGKDWANPKGRDAGAAISNSNSSSSSSLRGRNEKGEISENSSDDEARRDEATRREMQDKKKNTDKRYMEIVEAQLNTFENQIQNLESKNVTVLHENSRLLERLAQLEAEANNKEKLILPPPTKKRNSALGLNENYRIFTETLKNRSDNKDPRNSTENGKDHAENGKGSTENGKHSENGKHGENGKHSENGKSYFRNGGRVKVQVGDEEDGEDEEELPKKLSTEPGLIISSASVPPSHQIIHRSPSYSDTLQHPPSLPPASRAPASSNPPSSSPPLPSLPNVSNNAPPSPPSRRAPASPAFNRPGGWSQIAADMDHELEELENEGERDRPPSTPKTPGSPSATTRGNVGARVRQSVDNLFAKKGQQYLSPIMNKSRQAASHGSSTNLMLGLSGKSFG